MVVGLGNPGRTYESTRHNIGRRVLETLRLDPPAGVFLLVPDCFMNTSGFPVSEAARKRGIQPSEILMVVDDFELPLGRLRLRAGGSSGGHNGLKSVFECLGTQAVPRLRIGVGPVPDGVDPADFVLESFRAEEKIKIADEVLPRAIAAVRGVLRQGLDAAMTEFNAKTKGSE